MEQKYEDMFTSQMKIIYHDFQEKSRTTSTQSVNNIHLYYYNQSQAPAWSKKIFLFKIIKSARL